MPQIVKNTRQIRTIDTELTMRLKNGNVHRTHGATNTVNL